MENVSNASEIGLSNLTRQTPEAFPGFNDWFAELISEVKPDYVVGIARGAVRLLQLQNVRAFLGECPILSDYALPFLHEAEIKGKRVLLFDDSVIFGSTLAQVRDYLLSRGALVFSAAYTIDRYNFFGEQDPSNDSSVCRSVHSEIPVRSKKLLWPDQVRRHHNQLIEAILDSERDYNLDFPKVRITTSDFSGADLPYLIKLFSRVSDFRNLHDVSSASSAANGMFRYTALIEPRLFGRLADDSLANRPYSKLRFIFVPKLNEILLTPMPQLRLAALRVANEIRFRDEILQAVWQTLRMPDQTDVDIYQKSLFRLFTFLEGLLLASSLQDQLTEALEPDLTVLDRVLVKDDLNPVMGEYNARALQRAWLELSSRRPRLASTKTTGDATPKYLNEPLLTAINQKWEELPRLKPHGSELMYEILGKVFLTLRAVTDNTKARTKNPDASRLEVGLTYEDIKFLLDQYCNITLSEADISLAIDMCVDNGQAVPKILKQGRTWLRGFYSGENEDAHTTLQLKSAFHSGYSDFVGLKDAFHQGYAELANKTSAPSLTEFDLIKLAVVLKDLFSWLPISTKPYTFGRIATVAVGYSEQRLVDWLVNHGTGPLRQHTDEDRRTTFVLNGSYEPCVEPSWQPSRSKEFLDAFQYIATAFALLKEPAPKLLLSTCRTHHLTFNAVAVEAYNWVENERGDFRRLLAASRLNLSSAVRDKETVLQSVYFSTRFLSEARDKYDIFHKRFSEVQRMLEKAFKRQGVGGGAYRFWQFTILKEKNLLDPTHDREINLRFECLMPILTQMRHLTGYYTAILRHLDLISDEDINTAFSNEGFSTSNKGFKWLTEYDFRRHARLYNENIQNRKVAGLSIEKTHLPVNIPPDRELPSLWFTELQETVERCFHEIGASLFSLCPRYRTQEVDSDFPFAPLTDRRVQVDGTVERILYNRFILTIEIVKSTDNIQTNEMKDFIIKTFSTFPKTNDLHFDKSGNDAFLVCSIDPDVLIDIAKIVMREGEALKKRGGTFGGTRKGIFYGTVRHVIDNKGHERITDALRPNDLPQAFSILAGFDKQYSNKPNELNLAMIIEESVANDLFPRLNIKFAKNNAVKVSGKHFYGKCYFFNLADSTIESQ